MSSEQAKPVYYDGSGTFHVEKISDAKTTIISPGSNNIPLITNIDQKPSYYDGSGRLDLNASDQ